MDVGFRGREAGACLIVTVSGESVVASLLFGEEGYGRALTKGFFEQCVEM
jgi:hypothetical protein